MATRRRPADLADHTMDRVAARELSRIIVVAPPPLAWAAALPAAVGLHHAWPGPAGAAATAAVGVVLAWLDLALTHHRSGIGRWFPAVTILAIFWWGAWVTAAGLPLHSPQLRSWLVGGVGLAVAWMRWLHVHDGGDEAGMAKPFGKAALRAGLEGVRLIGSRRVDKGTERAEIDHPGTTHDEIVKALPVIEASWPRGIPPGSLSVSKSEDKAHRTKLVKSDPRVLSKPIPWPGPSRPGGSIADPIRVARWQDGSTGEWVITNYHEQGMATTGAGKTMGFCYNELGETFTRADAAVVIADLAKGNQFIGPMLPALHVAVTDPEGLRKLLNAVDASCAARGDFLASKGLGNWERGCGLMHGTLWIEEAADAFDALGGDLEDLLFPLVRKVRSAGWRVVYSLHRASFEQMPTFLRGMVSRTTMGVREHDDARFGLSPVQIEADCSPELWSDNPKDRGKFYRDAPVLEREYRTMPGRFFYWGPDTSLMAKHAAAYPAAGRPWDAVTAPFFAELMGAAPPATAGVSRPSVTLAPPAQEADMDDDTRWGFEDDGPLDLDDIEGGDLPIGGPPPEPGPETPVSPDVALNAVRRQIHQWRAAGGVPQRRGGPSRRITIADLRPLAKQLGRQRTWLYWVMPKLEAEREVTRDEDGWQILDRAA